MKKRLFGLLALTLCIMVVAMPVAMAGPWYYYSNTQNSLDWDDLIAGGVQLGTNGAVNTATLYVDNEYTAFASPDYTLPAHPADGFYRCDAFYQESGGSITYDYGLFVSDMGAPVINETVGNLQIIGFPSLDRFEAAFADAFEAAGVDGSEWLKAYYEIDAYTQVDNANAWRRKDVDGSIQFTIPLQNVTEAYVFHITSNDEVEQLTSIVTSNGIKVTTSGFSPFAVAYKLGKAPSSQPKTGDSAQLALWFALAGLSLAGMTVIAVKRRKNA